MKKNIVLSLIVLLISLGVCLDATANIPPDYYDTCNSLLRSIRTNMMKLDIKYMEIQSLQLQAPLNQAQKDELKKLEDEAKVLEANITNSVKEYQNNNCDITQVPPRPVPPPPMPGVPAPAPAPLPPGAPLPNPPIPGGGINPVQ